MYTSVKSFLMRRINIYIDESEDAKIDYLAKVFDINRSELIRRAIINYIDTNKNAVDNFADDLIEPDTSSEMTPAKLRLWANYKDDVIDFIQSELKWHTLDNGFSRVVLYDKQKELLNDFTNYNKIIVRKSRQIGYSKLICSHALHTAIFNQYKNIALIACKLSSAQELLDTVKAMLNDLPSYLKPDITKNNRNCIELSNGCSIIAVSLSADSVKGRTLNSIYVDECAFARRDTFDAFMTQVAPLVHYGCKLIIGSTPYGHNHFHKMFVDALTQYNDFRHITARYDVVPHRNNAWKANQIACMGLDKFNAEYECDFISPSDVNRVYGDCGEIKYVV